MMNHPTPSAAYCRKRVWYVIAVIVMIALGLASRHFRFVLPAAFGKYPGDVLWVLMLFRRG
jgi:hypothetical protein